VTRRRRPGPDLLGSSVIHEPSAREREEQGRKASRPPRRPVGRRLVGPVLVLGLIGAVGVVGAGYAGKGPYARLAEQRRAPDDAVSSAPAAATPGGTPPPTRATLSRQNYRPGDCVVWDQTRSDSESRIVPCTSEHIMEVTGRVSLRDLPREYPDVETWRVLLNEKCIPLAEQHLGGPLDPYGRYMRYAVTPTNDSWAEDDRELWCAIAANWRGPVAGEEPALGYPTPRLTEPASRATQHWSYQPGDCLTGDDYLAVPCTTPHTDEVVGEITLPDGPPPPAREDRNGWAAIVGERCQAMARSYRNDPLRNPWTVAWHPIGPESWAAGKRNVTCYIGQWDGSRWVTTTGSVRGVGA
jgi:hypothetical protein